MENQDVRIPDEIVSEVLTLASRRYAEMTEGYSESELVEAGKAVDIPPQLIQQAIQEVQSKHQQEKDWQAQHKKKQKFVLKVGTGILAILMMGIAWSYNALISSDSQTEAAWAQVENQLQRRADLIPNLVSVTQSYAQHETELVYLLLHARSAYTQAQNKMEKTASIAKINQAIQRFQDYAVTHPQLQSSQLFVNLQYELAGTENRLAVERMR